MGLTNVWQFDVPSLHASIPAHRKTGQSVYMTSLSYSDTNLLPENEAAIVKQQKMTSHKVDDLYSTLKCIFTLTDYVRFDGM